jgi:hypothetical protein
LHYQIPTYAGRGVRDCLGASLKIAGSDQFDKAVAQILSLKQYKNNKDDD